ncbi:MAG TPA: DNA-directed RNA polymerase subunit A' [Methanocorpusculum sp.]|nr:DNA-directed RNA polymerase subunit A' [Methanocorpusculum sp.]
MTSPKKIGKIEFGLLSPNAIRDMSVCKVIWADTYDDDGFPYPKGLMDPSLGVIDPGLICKTCGQKQGICPGHFGHIDLVKPVIHVGYTKLIRKLLRITCRNCGRLLLDKDEIEHFNSLEEDPYSEESISEKDVKKERTCPYCHEQQFKINFEKPTSFVEVSAITDKNDKSHKFEHKLTPSDIRERLEKIPDDDLRLLGIDASAARPEWTILTVLPVPPVTVRPSIILENGQRSEDDLTHKLVDILRINQRFKENQEAGAPQLIIEDLWELLQYHVITYLDNEVAGCPPARHRSGRPLKTLSQRLKGKDGRFRGYLSGKRVNFSSRTVISPDPNLSIGEVGIPLSIANEMSVPVRITSKNIEDIKYMIRIGPNRPTIRDPCGVNYVTRPNGRRVRLIAGPEGNCNTVADMVEPGWAIDRQLRDGDIVLFNRQPSLHRMSIMSHRVKIMNGRTFRLNPAVCPPYNADFDGDEMNLHIPQTEEARAEAELLISVQENILSPRFGRPIIGGIHDHISGIFLLTNQTKWYTKSEFLYLLKYTNIDHLPKPGKIENGISYWSNKQVFSMILPKDINMLYTATCCLNCNPCTKENCPHDAYVKIIDGQLISGTIDKKSVGAMDGAILNRIIRLHGVKRAREYIDDLTRLSIQAIMLDGFSYGINDTDLGKEEYKQIDELLNKAKTDVAQRISVYEQGRLDPMPGRTQEETLEMLIMRELGKARDSTGDIASRHLGFENSAVVMAVSGARGSMLNIAQMAGCIGQQAVRGERIVRGYEDRTLPHFKRGDKGADAHGFVLNSYKSGLTPVEFFFHAIGGREGLVDTAVRTSQSGYLQRRMINALQDLKIAYDGTVRTPGGKIIQFNYGEDGTDPAKSAAGLPVDVKGIVESVLKVEV